METQELFQSLAAGRVPKHCRVVRRVRAHTGTVEEQDRKGHVFSLPATLWPENFTSFGDFPANLQAAKAKQHVAAVFAFAHTLCSSDEGKERMQPFTGCAVFMEEVWGGGSLKGHRLWVFDERPLSPGRSLQIMLAENAKRAEDAKNPRKKRRSTQIEIAAQDVCTHEAFLDTARVITGAEWYAERLDFEDLEYLGESCPARMFSVEAPRFAIPGADPEYNDRRRYTEGGLSIPLAHKLAPECLLRAFDFWTFENTRQMCNPVATLGFTGKNIWVPAYGGEVQANIQMDPTHAGWTAVKREIPSDQPFYIDLQTGLGVYADIEGEKAFLQFARGLLLKGTSLLTRVQDGVRRCHPEPHSWEGEGESKLILVDGEQIRVPVDLEGTLEDFIENVERHLGFESPAITFSGSPIDMQVVRSQAGFVSEERRSPPPPGLGLSAWLSWEVHFRMVSRNPDGSLVDFSPLGCLARGSLKQHWGTLPRKAMYHWKDNQKLQIESCRVVPGSLTAVKFLRAYSERVLGGCSKNEIDTEFDAEFLKRCVCSECLHPRSICRCQGERTFGIRVPAFERKYKRNTFFANYMVWVVEHMGLLGTPKGGPAASSGVECLLLLVVRLYSHVNVQGLSPHVFFAGAGAGGKSWLLDRLKECSFGCEVVGRTTQQVLAVNQDRTGKRWISHEAEHTHTGNTAEGNTNEKEGHVRTALSEGLFTSQNCTVNPNDPTDRRTVMSVSDLSGFMMFSATNHKLGGAMESTRTRRLEFHKNKVRSEKNHSVADCNAAQARMGPASRKLQNDFVELHKIIDIMGHYRGCSEYLSCAHPVTRVGFDALFLRVSKILDKKHGIRLEPRQGELLGKLAHCCCVLEALLEYFQGRVFTIPALLEPEFQAKLWISEQHTVSAFALMSECLVPSNHRRIMEAIWSLYQDEGCRNVVQHTTEDASGVRDDPNWICCGNGGTDNAPLTIMAEMEGGTVVSKENIKDTFAEWLQQPLRDVFTEYDMYDPSGRFGDNRPGPNQGRTRGMVPTRVKQKGYKWLFHVSNFVNIRDVRKGRAQKVDPVLDAVRSALPHKYARKKNFVYPCTRENAQHRVALDSFQTEPNGEVLEQNTRMEFQAEMADFVTGDASSGARQVEYLNVDRDDLAASKRLDIMVGEQEGLDYLLEIAGSPPFPGQTLEQQLEVHLHGDIMLSCSCGECLGFVQTAHEGGKNWEEVEASLWAAREGEEPDLLGLTCECGLELEYDGVQGEVLFHSRLHADNLREHHMGVYDAARVCAPKKKRKGPDPTPACGRRFRRRVEN